MGFSVLCMLDKYNIIILVIFIVYNFEWFSLKGCDDGYFFKFVSIIFVDVFELLMLI